MTKQRRTASWYIARHIALKEQKEKLEEKLKEVNEKIAEIEFDALRKFDEDTIEGARSEVGTGFVQELEHYRVDDRAALDKFVRRNKSYMDLFQNRVSKEACKDIIKKRRGRAIPGVTYFTTRHFRTRRR